MEYRCKLCGGAMKEDTVSIKTNKGNKVKTIKVSCMRCNTCKKVDLTEAQLNNLPSGITTNDFLAYSLLQERISIIALMQKGIIKEELVSIETEKIDLVV